MERRGQWSRDRARRYRVRRGLAPLPGALDAPRDGRPGDLGWEHRSAPRRPRPCLPSPDSRAAGANRIDGTGTPEPAARLAQIPDPIRRHYVTIDQSLLVGGRVGDRRPREPGRRRRATVAPRPTQHAAPTLATASLGTRLPARPGFRTRTRH